MLIITIDGPSGAGKGTVAKLVAEQLNLSLLDSGALYRIAGVAASNSGVDIADGTAVAELLPSLNIEFTFGQTETVEVILNGENITDEVRSQTGADLASKVALHEAVRDGLLSVQRNFAKGAGVVADGRDMGTVVFPDAALKVYLTASAEVRAERRFKQLQSMGQNVSIARLLTEIRERDNRDQNRPIAPLKPADDAIIIDSSLMTIDEVVDQIVNLVS